MTSDDNPQRGRVVRIGFRHVPDDDPLVPRLDVMDELGWSASTFHRRRCAHEIPVEPMGHRHIGVRRSVVDRVKKDPTACTVYKNRWEVMQRKGAREAFLGQRAALLAAYKARENRAKGNGA